MGGRRTKKRLEIGRFADFGRAFSLPRSEAVASFSEKTPIDAVSPREFYGYGSRQTPKASRTSRQIIRRYYHETTNTTGRVSNRFLLSCLCETSHRCGVGGDGRRFSGFGSQLGQQVNTSGGEEAEAGNQRGPRIRIAG